MADQSTKALFDAAKAASEKAHCLYSDFPVGAAIRCPDGTVFSGANIENISFPEGWCAETSAISHMIMAGHNRIAEIAVYAARQALTPPCGGCRQRIAEFGQLNPTIHLCDENGIAESVKLSDLLPRGFETEVLGK